MFRRKGKQFRMKPRLWPLWTTSTFASRAEGRLAKPIKSMDRQCCWPDERGSPSQLRALLAHLASYPSPWASFVYPRQLALNCICLRLRSGSQGTGLWEVGCPTQYRPFPQIQQPWLLKAFSYVRTDKQRKSWGDGCGQGHSGQAGGPAQDHDVQVKSQTKKGSLLSTVLGDWGILGACCYNETNQIGEC